MRKLYRLILTASVASLPFMMNCPAGATSVTLVISQVQLGDSDSASNEFVEIYNNSSSEVDITDWCLFYASAGSNLVGTRMVCFLSQDPNTHLFLPSHESLFVISNELSASQPDMSYDFRFSGTLWSTGGHVRLIDNFGDEVDMLGWGTAISAEGNSVAVKPSTGKILGRKIGAGGVLIDSDNNGNDFEEIAPKTSYPYDSVYEVEDVCSNVDGFQAGLPDGMEINISGQCISPLIDLCGNIDGFQDVLPVGYALDENGDCQADVCNNIDGHQNTIPGSKDPDGSGGCIDHDECSNLEGVQAVIPSGYKINLEGSCTLDLKEIQITEVLPNADGSDSGNEFIEIYNPNDDDIELSNYVLLVGSKDYSFPTGSKIKTKEYLSFSNNEINFTLVNTSNIVRLESIDGTLIDEAVRYDNPSEGESWALFEGMWQYTNQLTPGKANLPMLVEEADVEIETNSPKSCGPGQYRNPETNRCKNVANGTVLKACKDGQYRSEETGRCRSIVSDVAGLIPCPEGQERNPATNRCRAVAVLGASDVKSCPEGQERNSETNRCRKIQSSNIPKASFEPKAVANAATGNIVLWSSAGVGTAVVGYGLWEWREEAVRLGRKIRSLVGSGK